MEENHPESAQNTSKGHSKRPAKALFTLAYMVSFELRKLLQMPAVRQLISQSHLTKFQHYFKQSIAVLIQDEIVQKKAAEQNSVNTNQKKKINFSTCFIELATTLGISLVNIEDYAVDDEKMSNSTLQLLDCSDYQFPNDDQSKIQQISKHSSSTSGTTHSKIKRSQSNGRSSRGRIILNGAGNTNYTTQISNKVALLRAEYKNPIDNLAPLNSLLGPYIGTTNNSGNQSRAQSRERNKRPPLCLKQTEIQSPPQTEINSATKQTQQVGVNSSKTWSKLHQHINQSNSLDQAQILGSAEQIIRSPNPDDQVKLENLSGDKANGKKGNNLSECEIIKERVEDSN